MLSGDSVLLLKIKRLLLEPLPSPFGPVAAREPLSLVRDIAYEAIATGNRASGDSDAIATGRMQRNMLLLMHQDEGLSFDRQSA